MSIEIISAGILDTIQDHGRYGNSASGINPGGVMDRVAASVANFLVDNDEDEAVIEAHYPASVFLFRKVALIAITGADHSPQINDQPIPINTPVIVPANSKLKFAKPKKGSRSYIAVHGGFEVDKWLNSYSTNIKAKAGGFEGRKLKEGDVLRSTPVEHFPFKDESALRSLPWHADTSSLYRKDNTIRITKGKEYDLLTDCSATIVEGNTFSISIQSDRMGYRMNGSPLQLTSPLEMISSAVTRGTVQLLPGGQLIILMADHQTTGGYPRLAHIITADIPTLAQLNPNTSIRFEVISLEEAENILLQQYHHLQQVKTSCMMRLEQLVKNV